MFKCGLHADSATLCRFVGGLSSLHTYFASNNKTTYEHFRSRHNQTGNPYDLGCNTNWRQVLDFLLLSKQMLKDCTPIVVNLMTLLIYILSVASALTNSVAHRSAARLLLHDTLKRDAS